jgi:hypothetical protein
MRMIVSRSRTSTLVCVLLLLVSVLVVTGCQDESVSRSGKGSGERSENQTLRKEFPKGHYWLNVKVDQFKGSYTLLCNGFPVKKMWVNVIETDDEWAADMQTALIGEGNVASIRIRPFLDYSGKRLTVGTAQLEAWVEIEETRQSYVPLHKIKRAEGEGLLRAEAVDSTYSAWKKQVQEQWKKLLEEKATPKEAFVQLKTWRWNHPMEVKTTPFKNRDGPDFSRVFEEAPKLKDTPATRERLRDYAMRLRDLMAEKDTAGLVKEFRPEMRYSYQIGAHDADSFEEYVSTYQKHYVLEGAEEELNFSRTDVRLQPWVDGRVWQLRRKDAEGLLRRIEVYVAELEGDLQVVR